MSKTNRTIFTSESVSEGHPDKICDQISDAILDACLKDDKDSMVACECFATTGMVLIGGEITTNTFVDIQKEAREVVKDIGYTNPEYGFDYQSMAVLNTIHSQSPEIFQGVAGKGLSEYAGRQGAGDQGLMFGFACKETPEFMPAPIIYAHRLLLKAVELRKNNIIKWLRPDAKSQVSLEYEGQKPLRINTVVLSHQHDPLVKYNNIKEELIEKIIKPVLEPTGLFDAKTTIFINPTGSFSIGGPAGDTGLTGRKIIVDTYGGAGRHGGGAFSGKDPSKVDRSASYAARYIARHVIACDLAEKCELQLAYAIGVPDPVSVSVNTYNTGKISDEEIARAIVRTFPLDPAGIIKMLDLRRPIYRSTSNYGHFGRSEFTWERSDRCMDLNSEI